MKIYWCYLWISICSFNYEVTQNNELFNAEKFFCNFGK